MKFGLVLAGVALTVLCWGMYGNVLHIGQGKFVDGEGTPLPGYRLKPLICVGLAYLIVAVLVPILFLAKNEELARWTMKGVSWSMLAGVAGALGALGIILALTSGGSPIYVMPLVFGGAPVVNTFLAMAITKAYKEHINPMFYVGLVLVAAGAVCVLKFAPKKGHGKPPAAKTVQLDPQSEARQVDPAPADSGDSAT